MLNHIEKFLSGLMNDDSATTATPDNHQIGIATAALLVHCAKADGHQSVEERKAMYRILANDLGLAGDEIESVIEIAEDQERNAVDIHRFTRVLHEALDRGERKRIVGLLYEIALADGKIDGDESNTVELTARLLHVEAADRVAVRQAVLSKQNS